MIQPIRSLVLFAGLWILVSSLASSAPSVAAAEAEKPRQPYLLIGDSMMKVGTSAPLKRALEAKGPPGVVVDVRAKSSTGLSRPDFYDWPKAARAAVAAKAYGTVVVMMGANDCQAITESKKRHSYGTPAWGEIYRGRVRSMLDILCADERSVVWVGMPPMRQSGFNRRIGQLNELVSDEIGKRKDCARYVSVAAALTDAKGAFVSQRKIGRKQTKLRDPDGIHLTPAAGELVTTAVLGALDP